MAFPNVKTVTRHKNLSSWISGSGVLLGDHHRETSQTQQAKYLSPKETQVGPNTFVNYLLLFPGYHLHTSNLHGHASCLHHHGGTYLRQDLRCTRLPGLESTRPNELLDYLPEPIDNCIKPHNI